MDTEYDVSRVEQAKRDLYSSEGRTEQVKFSHLTPNKTTVAGDWGDHLHDRAASRRSVSVRILKWSIAAAVLALFASLGYLWYSLYDPFAKPSDKNITFTLDFPTDVRSGSVNDLRLTVANDNKVPLEYAKLTVFYPQGTKHGDTPDRDLLKDEKSFGAVAANAKVEYAARPLLLGEEKTDKEVRVVLEYRFQGVNSIFTKEEKWPIGLLSSPVNVTVKTLKEVNAGQPVEMEIVVVSNALIPLRNMLLRVEYPQSFTFEDGDPKPTYGSNGWKLGDIEPSEKMTIRLRGTLSGEDTEEKAFKVTVGEASPREEREVATVHAATLAIVAVKKPFIGIDLFFDGKIVDDAAAVFGKGIKATIRWKNNLPTQIADAEIEVKVRGTALDRLSVSPRDGGFYRSLDDTIIWDDRGTPQLGLVEAREAGDVTFTFSPLPSVSGGKPLKSPTVIVDVTVRGKRTSESGVPEEITSITTRTVKITSDVRLSAKALYFAGPFKNRGPLPPRVEQETSYTALWSITNTSNEIGDVEVRGTLPPYVTWLGSVVPGSEHVAFDKNTNQVVWRVGNVPAGTGVTTQARELYFQVGIVPSISQIRLAPEIVSDITMIGRDLFNGERVDRVVQGVVVASHDSDPRLGRDMDRVAE